MHLGQGNVAILATLALAHVQHLPVEIQVLTLKVAKLKIAEPTTIEHGKNQSMLKQFWGLQQLFYLPLVQYHGEFLGAFNGRKYDPHFFHPKDAVGIAKSINGVLEKTVGWSLVL